MDDDQKFMLLQYNGTNWQEICRSQQTIQNLVQMVNVQDAVTATGTTIFPNDDTTPVKTEGDEYMTLAITPTLSANDLLITAIVNLGTSVTTNQQIGVGLFQDTTTNAIAAQGQAESSATTALAQNIVLTHKMTAGTTIATTFKIRAGDTQAGTTTFNNNTYGGVMASSITIMEITV